MDTVIGILAIIVPSLVVVVSMFFAWLMSRRQEARMDKLDHKIDTGLDKLDHKIDTGLDKLDHKIDTGLAKLDEKIDTGLDSLDHRIKNLGNQIKNSNQYVLQLRESLGNLVSYLQGQAGESLPETVKLPPAEFKDFISSADAKSPLVLTDIGRESAGRMEADRIVAKYIKHIIVPPDANKLVIQDACFNFAFGALLKAVDQEDRDIIQNEMYERGKDAKEDTLIVFGILFRDAFFKEWGLPVPASSENDSKSKGKGSSYSP